ncbi:MAG: hypothetical protein M1383_03265 [Patescibacteria group bacterium]|nr:hypothetical protein [Patescibacteria group bacterium]
MSNFSNQGERGRNPGVNPDEAKVLWDDLVKHASAAKNPECQPQTPIQELKRKENGRALELSGALTNSDYEKLVLELCSLLEAMNGKGIRKGKPIANLEGREGVEPKFVFAELAARLKEVDPKRLEKLFPLSEELYHAQLLPYLEDRHFKKNFEIAYLKFAHNIQILFPKEFGEFKESHEILDERILKRIRKSLSYLEKEGDWELFLDLYYTVACLDFGKIKEIYPIPAERWEKIVQAVSSDSFMLSRAGNMAIIQMLSPYKQRVTETEWKNIMLHAKEVCRGREGVGVKIFLKYANTLKYLEISP